MPFYSNLKEKENDSPLIKAKKKRVIKNIKKLNKALKKHIKDSTKKPTSSKSIKIATWNVREFGGTSYKGRSFEELFYMAEIISHFDIVALQEVRGDLKEFKKLKSYLGPAWSYIATDVTDGGAGNKERMAFLYNKETVFFKNIAGELTLEEGGKIRASFGERAKLENGIKLNLPNNVDLSGIYDASTETKNGRVRLREDLEIPLPDNCNLEVPDGSSLVIKKGQDIIRPARGKAQVTVPQILVEGEEYGLRFPENSFDDSFRQFARTPFLISFQSGWLKINLCTVHIYYGSATNVNKLKQREKEIELLTKSLANKAENEFKDDKESFLCVLGDFNILGHDHPTMKALESNGFELPEELKSIPGSNVEQNKAYDQIAFWKPSRIRSYSKLDIIGANVFDFFDHVFTFDDEDVYRQEGTDFNGLKSTSKYKTWRTYKMSDHLPMWIEIRTNFKEEYLESITPKD